MTVSMHRLSLPELRVFAMSRHVNLYGRHPYVFHLDAVVDCARRHGLGELYERAAFGHDLLDDTDTSLPDLVDAFGVQEAALIYSVSAHGHNRAARRDETISRLWAHPAGIDLKGIDRSTNIAQAIADRNRPLIKMYLGEHSAFAPLFARCTPSLQQELDARYALGAQLIQP